MHRLQILLASTLLLAACVRGGAVPSQASGVVSVRVAAVETERLAQPVAATGVLAAKEEVALGFKVGGVIARVLVDEGRGVRAGDTLAVLDLGEIDAGVTRARSAAEKADRDLARARRLYADSVATLEQVQNAATGAEAARAELDATTFNRRHALIIAPAGGTILRRQGEPGELVAPGATILTLGSRARGFVVRAGLADRDVVRVRRGDSAEVRFDAVPGRTFRGTVTEIAGAVDATTGTYAVEVRLPDPAAAALPTGLVADLSILPAATRPVALIPIEAVLEADGTHAVVFVLSADGKRAERRAVSIAFLSGDRVAVAAGLDGVRAVITEGAAYLDDRSAVRVQP
jgi:membrane fusion protein, multidrug efflux system